MKQRKELSFPAIVTLRHLCEMQIAKNQVCECLELGFTCRLCRAKAAVHELDELINQIADDFQSAFYVEQEVS